MFEQSPPRHDHLGQSPLRAGIRSEGSLKLLFLSGIPAGCGTNQRDPPFGSLPDPRKINHVWYTIPLFASYARKIPQLPLPFPVGNPACRIGRSPPPTAPAAIPDWSK